MFHDTILNWFIANAIYLWLIDKFILSPAIGSLVAPTKDSGKFYIWFFKFSNTFAGNWHRAASTILENSPNWKDAVGKVLIDKIDCPECGKKIFNGKDNKT